jgi:hypothetical protein
MESIHIEQTQKTPLFILRDGYIRMSGRSIPQNSQQLYKFCFEWIEQYVKEPAKETKVDLFFEYIDTSSTRCIVDLLESLMRATHNGDNQVTINWYYESDDIDIHELGMYIQTHLKIPINTIPIEDEEDIPSN